MEGKSEHTGLLRVVEEVSLQGVQVLLQRTHRATWLLTMAAVLLFIFSWRLIGLNGITSWKAIGGDAHPQMEQGK